MEPMSRLVFLVWRISPTPDLMPLHSIWGTVVTEENKSSFFPREFALLQSLSHLFHLVQCDKERWFLPELNSKGLCLSSGKEKENYCLVFTSSIKRENGRFQVVGVQRRQKNVQKWVMHVCPSKPIAFCLSRFLSCSSTGENISQKKKLFFLRIKMDHC